MPLVTIQSQIKTGSTSLLPRRGAVILWSVVLGVTLMMFFSEVFNGVMHYTDEMYMALNCRYYGDGPLGMLTFYTGNLAQRIFGDTLLSLRVLSYIYIVVGLAIPVVYFYRRTRNAPWALFLMSLLITFFRGSSKMYWSWDTGALPYESGLLVALAAYIDSPSMRKAAGAGILCALIALARIPSVILAVPITALIILVKRSPQPFRWKALGISAICFTATLLLLILLMKGSVGAYIAAWTPDNIINGHNLNDFGEFMRRFKEVGHQEVLGAKYYFAILALALLTVSYIKVFGRKGLLVVPVILLYLVWRRLTVIKDDTLSLYYVPVFLLLYLPVLKLFRRNISLKGSLTVLTVVLMAFVPAIGSDYILWHIYLIYGIPVLMVLLYPYRNGVLKWLLIFTLIPSLCYDCVIFSRFCKNEVRGEDYNPRYVGIRFSKVEYMPPGLELSGYVERLKDRGVHFAFYGDHRYPYTYQYMDEKPYAFQMYHYYDRDETLANFAEYLRRYDVVIVYSHYMDYVQYDDVRDYATSLGANCERINSDYDAWSLKKP